MRNQMLQTVHHAFFVRDQASARALKRFRNTPGRLSHLLRHHSESEIGELESWWRDEFDYLLGYYAMVELGCICGVIRVPLPTDYRGLALRVLSHPAVKRYYEVNYPVVLPQLHRQRLEGNGRSVIDAKKKHTNTFMAMLDIGSPLPDYSPLETFLYFLDDGARDGTDITDVIDALASRQELAKVILGSDDTDHLWLGVQGFAAFLELSVQLLEILDSLEGEPYIQSACWQRLGYWYGRMNDQLGVSIKDAIGSVEAWSRTDTGGKPSEITDRWRRAIAQLASGRYAWRTFELAANVQRLPIGDRKTSTLLVGSRPGKKQGSRRVKRLLPA